MSKRKKEVHNVDDDDDDDDSNQRNQTRTQGPQKVYDFHKKTIEVYPERLRELNRQFSASISSQLTSEPYSVLVGNCLDYVRQYFVYEDDFLQYSPWLAARLKQSRSDIANCLQNTIDLYDALARQDFDHLFENNSVESAPTGTFNKKKDDAPFVFNPPKSSATPTATFEATPPATINNKKSDDVPFGFNLPKTAAPTIRGESPTSNGFTFSVPPKNDSPAKSASPFSFSIPTSGFGTSTFSSEKQSTFSFAPPTSTLTFNPIPTPASGPSADADEVEPNEPPEPEKVVHESDAKLTYNCRMGVNKGGKLTKRGPVQVVLKPADDKNQMIIRSDDSLGRLFLNILWSKTIELKKNSTKDLTFVCQLNPAMPDIAKGEFVTILLRFDNEKDRNDAHEKLEKERS